MIRSDDGLLAALAEELKNASGPKTCVELYDSPRVRQLASSPNRVSDYLGNLWRKGMADRLPAPRANNSSARWAYQWRGQTGPQTGHTPALGLSAPVPSVPPSLLLNKPQIKITEAHGVITVEIPHLSLLLHF